MVVIAILESKYLSSFSVEEMIDHSCHKKKGLLNMLSRLKTLSRKVEEGKI
jgi:hypothetical protein